MRSLGVVAAWVTATVLGGCHNACQDVCARMKAYAEEDCGITVPDAELQECFDSQKDLDPEDAKACRDYGAPAAIENQWTCEDLRVYWAAPAPAES